VSPPLPLFLGLECALDKPNLSESGRLYDSQIIALKPDSVPFSWRECLSVPKSLPFSCSHVTRI
jgi:hypothetical protein